MNLWVVDPKDGARSVSLTFLVVSFSALVIGSGLEMAKVVESTGGLVELFGICAGLYFGRKFQTKSGSTLETATPETTTPIVSGQ